jgi:hypothetical protein
MVRPVLRVLCSWGAASLVGLGSASLIAQQPVATFGVDSPSVAVISAWEMEPDSSTATWSSAELNAYRYLTNAGLLLAPVHVPQGASILSIELDACDSSALKGVNAALSRYSAAGLTVLATLSTGDGPMPGCDRFAADLTAGPETVDNYLYTYLVSAQNGSLIGDATIGAIRVVYELQVSPGPGTATFNDVPTSDPAFQFIEALVASGVTAGCGGGNYCPDAPLTRRQMAVFLAKALGLFWPELPAN